MVQKDNQIPLIIQKTNQLLQEKPYIIIAIDGRSAAGKTTFAHLLQKELTCNVIHMDDFFLRPKQRTEERMSLPGENIDHERFLTEVLLPLSKHQSFSYRPYDCHTQNFKKPIMVQPNPVSVVEGVYSCHPALWDYYDLHIFLDVDSQTQNQRIHVRNDAETAKRFEELWIPLEEKYFSAFGAARQWDCYFKSIDESNKKKG